MMIQSIIAGAMLLQGAPAGETAQAETVAAVQTREDPAELINLGVKLAIAGETEKARAVFQKVRSMRVDYTLETTDGRYVYPADLARKGLAMLDNGEFAKMREQIARR